MASTNNQLLHKRFELEAEVGIEPTIGWAVYTSGLLWKQFDFIGQMVEHRYDNFGGMIGF